VFLLPLGPDGLPKGPVRRLFAAGQFLSGLAWTAGSDALLFSAYREGSQTLWKISASGGERPQRVSIAGDRAYQPTLALHARRLVFRQFVQDSNIWRIPMPGFTSGGTSPATRLITSTWLDDSPQYSPDGRRIAFISNRSGSYEIWGCQQDGSGCNQWTSIGGPHVGSPRWSPDGRWIVYDRVDQGRRQLEVIAAEGGVPRRLTTEAFNHVRPSYSRDGRWIYFGCDRTGRWEIWKMPAQGGEAVQVTRQGGGVEAFESADGQYVYYDKTGTRTLWRIPAGGGKEELAVEAPIRHGHWAVLKDGLLILNPEAQPTPTLERFHSASGRRETLRPLELGQITVSGFTTPAVAVSPDGRWILYVNMERNTSDLMLVEGF
jgi:Tol biopolymer transport system component